MKCARDGCGNKLYAASPDSCVAQCCAVRGIRAPKRCDGFGDRFARYLALGYVIPFVKVTPESYRRWKVRWGFASACNCGERKEKLNRAGRWVVKPFRRFFAWLKALLPAPPAE